MEKFSFRQILIPVLVVTTIVVNVVANIAPFNGITTQAAFSALGIFFRPAPYTFSIWGAIFIALICFAGYQAQPNLAKAKWLDDVMPFFGIATLANIGWLISWHYQQLWPSMFLMVLMLSSLIAIYFKLEIGVYPASARTKYFCHVPFSIYLGWISVAAIANITGALQDSGWFASSVTAEAWAITMVLVATMVGFAALLLRRDIALALVVAWGLGGIYVHVVNTAPTLSASAATAIVLLLVLAMFVFFRPKGFMHEVEELKHSLKV
jgi:benzodiazapine receptor